MISKKFRENKISYNPSLSLNDVYIKSKYYDGNSRFEVNLTPENSIGEKFPIVSANMNAVTGKRMSETLARYGGIAILPQDMPIDVVERIINHVKKAPIEYDSVLTIDYDEGIIREAQDIINKRSHDTVILIDKNNIPKGYVTSKHLKDKDPFTRLNKIYESNFLTITHDEINYEENYNQMCKMNQNFILVVDISERISGILTKDDCVRFSILKPSVDIEGRLIIGCAVGISDPMNTLKTCKKYINFGADILVLDTAHGSQRRMIDSLKIIKQNKLNVKICAGNVCTAEETERLIHAGADIVKVNIGPGICCSTRRCTGVGKPSLSAVLECSQAARNYGKHVWADGGVKCPGDVCKYIGAGASHVMIGTILAACYESPGELQIEQNSGKKFKITFGMASVKANGERQKENTFQTARKLIFDEGTSKTKVYLKPGKESLGSLILEYYAGIASSCTYTGSKNLKEFYQNVEFGIQTTGGYIEGQPNSVFG